MIKQKQKDQGKGGQEGGARAFMLMLKALESCLTGRGRCLSSYAYVMTLMMLLIFMSTLTAALLALLLLAVCLFVCCRY